MLKQFILGLTNRKYIGWENVCNKDFKKRFDDFFGCIELYIYKQDIQDEIIAL